MSLSTPDQEDSFLVVIDTGFNGQLLIHNTDLARIKCDLTDLMVTAEFAGRQRHMLNRARSRIIWFGRPLDVDVLIAAAEQARAALTDEPIGLLGTALLVPHQLTVDFATRRVVISQNTD